MQFYWENHSFQILHNNVALNWYLGLSAFRKKIFVCIKFDKGGNSLQNTLSTLRIFTQISKFRCFHETKQNEVGRFFYNLAEFVFKYFWDSGRILASFAKFCQSQFTFHNMIAPLPKSPTHHPERAQAPLMTTLDAFLLSFPTSRRCSWNRLPSCLPVLLTYINFLERVQVMQSTTLAEVHLK